MGRSSKLALLWIYLPIWQVSYPLLCRLTLVKDFLTKKLGAVMALPLAMLPKLHKTRLGQKIGIGAMFSLTFIVIAFEIVRLVESLKGTGSSLNIVWISTEASIAVILSCIPSFNALIRHREKSKAIATVIASEYAELAASKTISRNKSTTPLAESHSAKSQDEVSQNIPLEHYDARDCV